MEFALTNELEIAYEVSGPPKGQPVVCLHGWPDSVHCWNKVGALLREAGCRVYTPCLRGFSPTRFLRPETMRSGQVEAFGHDTASFLETLNLREVMLVGHDWGARAAYVVAALFPERLCGLVTISTGYGTNSPSYQFGYEFAHSFWYQWFVATQRGKKAMHADRIEFCRYLWREWNPGWVIDEAAFLEASAAWQNDDWPEITIHAYLHRWGEAKGDPAYDSIVERMERLPQIRVPTTVIHGDPDPGNPTSSTAGKEQYFAGPYRRLILPGVGHLVPRNAPRETAQAILDLLAVCKKTH